MKRFFLIPLMTLMCSVMAWGENVSTAEEFQNAVDAKAPVINLQDNITLSSQAVINFDCTINLNEFNFSCLNGIKFAPTDKAANLQVTINGEEGNQINGIVATSTGWTNTGITTLTMNNVNVNATGNGVTVSRPNAIVSINGGLLKTTGTSVVTVTGQNAKCTIEDATIEGQKQGVNVSGAGSEVILNNGSVSVESALAEAGIKANSSSTITINGTTISVNGGSSLTSGILLPGGSPIVNFNSGTLSCTGTGETQGIRALGSSKVTIEEGATISAQYGVSVLGNGSILYVKGGTITGTIFGISGNGNNSGTTINITGGNISGVGGGIYHPQEGSLTIKGNPVITGHTAIQLCAGHGLTGSITGGRFEAYGEDERATKDGDGLIPDGAALSIVNRNYPGGMPQFTIEGGVFLAQHQNDAILAYSWDSSKPAGSRHFEWAAATSHLSAKEGIFSSNPATYVPAVGYTVTHLNPTPTVYNHDDDDDDVDDVVYADLWQVAKNFDTTNDFTDDSEVEYVELITDQNLTANQGAKYVAVKENQTLTVSNDATLNIGNGGLDLKAGSKLVVEPGSVVTVGLNGITSASGTENLVLESNADDQAVLLLDPDAIQNTTPLATVVLHTQAKQKSASPYNYIWEYFASPVVEITDANKPTNNFDEAIHGLFDGESTFVTGVYTWGGNDWEFVSSWRSLVPFKGYQLTNNSLNGGVKYTFKGYLMGNEDGEYAFTSNGYGYFGNSYSAPIVISNFLSALDNTVYERTVWLYDAGADTYVSVNPLAARLGSAKYKDGTAIKEIRSLQAFILNKKADGDNAPINYRDAIWNNPRINSLVSAAPAREQANDMQWTNIYVAANGNKEMVTLVEGEDFSNAFDNGADAGKYINTNSMNLYAATNDGEQAIVATDNLENTLISFQAGNATEYTLTFENSNENYLLRDNVTGNTIAMEEGATYTFTQDANTTAQARFEVIGIAKVPTAIENVEETAKKEGIYTISGQYVGRDFTKLPAGVYVVNGVKIVK